jgi:hypothetical protein
MEETFLSHKLEAMCVVNAQIADPVLRTSDGCLSLIAALALVEVRNDRSRGMEKSNGSVEHRVEWGTILPLRLISRDCLR